MTLPQRNGDTNAEDEQNASQQDYDVPPTLSTPKGNKSPPRRQSAPQDTYDTPPPSRQPSRVHSAGDLLYVTPSAPTRTSLDYDVPSSAQTLSRSLETYDMPPSNRSSMMSNLSDESTMTVSSSASNFSMSRVSNAASLCDSARSSLDISPQDMYDVPLSDPKSVRQCSKDSGLDLHYTPSMQKTNSFGSFIEDYDIPKSMNTSQSLDVCDSSIVNSNIPDDLYDVPKSHSGKVNSRLSDNAPALPRKKSSEVYDIPPQVTRDSVLSMRSDSSDGMDGQRLSTGNVVVDLPMYNELPLELDAAMDLNIKLQQNVQKATLQVLKFISGNWRTIANLEPKLYELKMACQAMKISLEEFVNFAQGTFANSSKLPDKRLVNKLFKHLSPLQNTSQNISLCIKHLDDCKWRVPDLTVGDDLNQIANMSRDLSGDVRKLTSIIQGNSTLLFKRGHVSASTHKKDFPASSSLPAMASTPNKPPVQPKPQVGPKLPTPNNVQKRPLPAPPSQERPLPVPPSQERPSHATPLQKSIFSSQPNLYSSTPQKRHSAGNILERVPNIEDDNMYDFIDENDYVRLESPAREKLQSKKLSVSSDQDEKTPVNTGSNNFDIPDCGMLTHKVKLDPNDRHVMDYYCGQVDTHFTLLMNAIDAFYGCIEDNMMPKDFISHSKFVVMCAHKIVFIGDTLQKKLSCKDMRQSIMHSANVLCDYLKLTVTSTKMAALQHPSVPATQELVDRVKDVSKSAMKFKDMLMRASLL